MPVSELTHRMSNEELASWAAYEAAVGPVGNERTEALLAQVSEQLHAFNWWYTQKTFTGQIGEEGVVHPNPLGEAPFTKDTRMPRPGDDWKFGQEDVMAHRLTLQEAVHMNDETDENPEEDGEAE